DDTFGAVEKRLEQACPGFRRKVLVKKDFGFSIPEDAHRHAAVFQEQRRSVLARARNHLLSPALRGEEWVLLLDVDVIEYPANIVELLTALGRDIVHPNCVCEYGNVSFDLNAWTDGGRKHLSDLRGLGMVRLQSVGGTMLLIRADRHRDGLVFPPFFYGAPRRRLPNP